MSAARQAHVVATGTANLASVLAALRRRSSEPVRIAGPDAIVDVERLVLPGVGTYGAAVERLRADGLVEPLRARLRAGRPTLAICLGLQLLAVGSDESPGATGLGILDGAVRRLPPSVRVPHLGWNRVEPGDALRNLGPGHAYFAHSFALLDPPGDGWRIAYATHGARFVAAAARDGVLACQFHPELSGAWGDALLGRWLEAGEV